MKIELKSLKEKKEVREKVKVKRGPTITDRQRKLVELMITNGKDGKFLTKRQITTAAGYGKNSDPYLVFQEQGVKVLMERLGITEAHRYARLSEFMWEDRKNRRDAIESIKEINKMQGSYAPMEIKLSAQQQEDRQKVFDE